MRIRERGKKCRQNAQKVGFHAAVTDKLDAALQNFVPFSGIFAVDAVDILLVVELLR